MRSVIFFGFIFLAIIFFSTLWLSGETGHEAGHGYDYQFHLVNAQGGTEWRHYPPHAFAQYPPLFKWVSSPFAFHENTFYLFTIVLLCLVFPFVLWYFVRNGLIVFSYFFVANFVWVIDIIGAYVQMVATILLVPFVFVKNPFFRIGLIFVSLLLHRWAWAMFLGYWFIEVIVEEVKEWRGLKLYQNC